MRLGCGGGGGGSPGSGDRAAAGADRFAIIPSGDRGREDRFAAGDKGAVGGWPAFFGGAGGAGFSNDFGGRAGEPRRSGGGAGGELCAGCGTDLAGEGRGSAIEASGKKYHVGCFRCSDCRTPIRGSYSTESSSGAALCQACNLARAPRCAGCSKPIQGKFIEADERPFHRECLACATCKGQLSGSFFKDGGKLMCPACHEKANPPKRCAECGGTIQAGGTVTSGGKSFHASCLACCKCRRTISGSFWKSDDGRGRLCYACRPRCGQCNEPLDGRRSVKVAEVSLHAECFRCCDCKGQIEGRFFEVPDTNPFAAASADSGGAGRHRCPGCHAQSLQRREDARERRAIADEDRKKSEDAARFKLHWRPHLVPTARQALRDLGIVDLPGGAPGSDGGLVCVCLSGGAPSAVSCAPLPPSRRIAAVSLPYLACALRVLRECGREPQFSLDPKDPHDLGGPFLLKRFYPPWLAGTIVGEVLFQADYALKQLCFGDRRLPGIPSAFDDDSDGHGTGEARASRQWFTVRSAGVTVSADGVLIPHAELGVEARRLTPSRTGYTDAPYTDPSDPTARQAAAVTARFGEVVSQLPVAAELLEVARATVLAVHLLTDLGLRCDDAALQRYQQPKVPEGEGYAIEIPTLVKDRRRASVVATTSSPSKSRSFRGGSDGGGGGGEEVVIHKQARSMRGGVDLAIPRAEGPASSPSSSGRGDGAAGRKVPVRSVAAKLLDDTTRRAPLPLFMTVRGA